MKKIILSIFCAVLISGCTSVSYHNQYGGNRLRSNVEYEKMDSNLHWNASFEAGCPIINYYQQFANYDEIVDVSISEKITTKYFFFFELSKVSDCSYSGTGVVFKKPSAPVFNAVPIKQSSQENSLPSATNVSQKPTAPILNSISVKTDSINASGEGSVSEKDADERIKEIMKKY